uniref:Uncharacterized protein n=1 Tax=Moniliophthora roreri TaxID=221103 RepID=A0A0W0F9U4_MONRR
MLNQLSLDLPSKNIPNVHVFIALELSGAIGVSFILLTALFSRLVKRCSTWYTFCASWVLSCLSYCLIFFSGDTLNPKPNKNLCIAQAALVYSVPILTALTTLILLVHSWYNVHFGLSKPPLESHERAMLILLSGPFLVWLFMFAGFSSFGLSNPSMAHNFGIVKISSLIVIIITFSTIPIQASLALSLARNFDRSDARSTISVQTLKTVIRVLIFSFLILVGFAEGLIRLLSRHHTPAVDIILAALPVSGVLIFGIQKDLFQAWKAWLCLKTKASSSIGTSSRRESKLESYELSDFSGSTGHY